MGFPPLSASTERLDAYYAGVDARASAGFFEAALAWTRAEVARAHAKLGQPVDKTEWHMGPQTLNASRRFRAAEGHGEARVFGSELSSKANSIGRFKHNAPRTQSLF